MLIMLLKTKKLNMNILKSLILLPYKTIFQWKTLIIEATVSVQTCVEILSSVLARNSNVGITAW